MSGQGGPEGIHPSAVVDPAAALEEGVVVGPGAVIEAGARLGAGAVVEACAYVGEGVLVGPGCRLGVGSVLLPGTSLGAEVEVGAGAVLGTDGFGYVLDQGRHRKIPQVGRVEVGDRAVIGAGSCVDRATTGVTRVGVEARLGAMIQIGHNASVGARTVMGDQGGLTGSSRVGQDCVLGFQVGVGQKAEVGDRSRLADRTGVLRSFPPDSDLAGFPARPSREVVRVEAALRSLPGLLDRLEAAGLSPGGEGTEP